MNAANYETLLAEIQAKGYEHPDIVAKMNQMSDEDIDTFIVFELGTGETDELRRIVDLYYDVYEYEVGDGYYPYDKDDKISRDARQVHVFQKDKNSWIQLTGPNIQGLDGDGGIKLLELLNGRTKENQMTAKLCLNRVKKTTDVVNVNANDLTPTEFACKVVDEMRSCGWAAQADEILSYTGGGHKCTHIISRSGKVLYPKV
jgi:hypothetical protein